MGPAPRINRNKIVFKTGNFCADAGTCRGEFPKKFHNGKLVFRAALKLFRRGVRAKLRHIFITQWGVGVGRRAMGGKFRHVALWGSCDVTWVFGLVRSKGIETRSWRHLVIEVRPSWLFIIGSCLLIGGKVYTSPIHDQTVLRNNKFSKPAHKDGTVIQVLLYSPHYAEVKRVTGPIFAAYLRSNTTSKKRRSSGDLLATL